MDNSFPARHANSRKLDASAGWMSHRPSSTSQNYVQVWCQLNSVRLVYVAASSLTGFANYRFADATSQAEALL